MIDSADELEERLAIRMEAAPSAEELLEGALALGRRGWRVLPLHGIDPRHAGCTCPRGPACPAAGKHPRASGWQTSATSDEGEIRRRWSGRDPVNVGVATGERSGIVVLDVDARRSSTARRGRR